MPITYTPFSTGTLNASDVNDRFEEIETYMNGRIVASDVNDNAVRPDSIHPPRFFASPAPRTEFVSSDIIYRKSDNRITNGFITWDVCSENWEPIPGLSATFHVNPQRPDHTVTANVLASWFCRDLVESSGKNTVEFGKKRVALYQLFVKRGDNPPQAVQGTRRGLFTSGKNDNRLSARNMHIASLVELTQGMNSIFVGVKTDGEMKDGWRIHHLTRTLICDVMYL